MHSSQVHQSRESVHDPGLDLGAQDLSCISGQLRHLRGKRFGTFLIGAADGHAKDATIWDRLGRAPTFVNHVVDPIEVLRRALSQFG